MKKENNVAAGTRPGLHYICLSESTIVWTKSRRQARANPGMPKIEIARLTNDGNSLHTPSSGFRRNPPLFLEGNKRNIIINKPPLVFPSLGRRGGIDSPLEGSPPKEGGVLPFVSIKNLDDHKITHPVFRLSPESTPLKMGGNVIVSEYSATHFKPVILSPAEPDESSKRLLRRNLVPKSM